MKCFSLAIGAILVLLSQAGAQETQVGRPRPNDSTTLAPVAASSVPPRVEPQEQSPALPPPATGAPAQPAPYNVEDSRAVIDWLLKR